MYNITDSILIFSFGFKKQTRNKIKQMYNETHDILLIKNNNNIYEDQNGILYDTYSNVSKIISVLNINIKSSKFRSGEFKLKDSYIFKDLLKLKKCEGVGFLTHEKTLQLLEAEFNKRFCNNSYRFEKLTDVYYTYVTSQREPRSIITLKLHFITKDIYLRDTHDYTKVIYDFWDLQYPISVNHQVFVPIDFIIEKFL